MKDLHLYLRPSITMFTLIACFCSNLAAAELSKTPDLLQQVNGLWVYTGLTTGDGQELPLTGIFLFKDGFFVQQAVFNGEPYEAQGSMAHAGPYSINDKFVHLVAEQTISTAPTDQPAIKFQKNTDHDITVERRGDDMTLVFGKGTSTKQFFKRIGPGDGDLYQLQKGVLALVDDHFILVYGDQDQIVSGYGHYKKNGESLSLEIIRWTEADTTQTTNLRDTTMHASFDGKTLTLEDGRTYQ